MKTVSVSMLSTYGLADLPDVDLDPAFVERVAKQFERRIEASLSAMLRPKPAAPPPPSWAGCAIRTDVT